MLTKTQTDNFIITLNRLALMLVKDSKTGEVKIVSNTSKPRKFDFSNMVEFLTIEGVECESFNWDKLYDACSGKKFITELRVRGEAYHTFATANGNCYQIFVDNQRFFFEIEKIELEKLIQRSISEILN